MADTIFLAQMLIASQHKQVNYDEYYEALAEKEDREWEDNIDE